MVPRTARSRILFVFGPARHASGNRSPGRRTPAVGPPFGVSRVPRSPRATRRRPPSSARPGSTSSRKAGQAAYTSGVHVRWISGNGPISVPRLRAVKDRSLPEPSVHQMLGSPVAAGAIFQTKLLSLSGGGSPLPDFQPFSDLFGDLPQSDRYFQLDCCGTSCAETIEFERSESRPASPQSGWSGEAQCAHTRFSRSLVGYIGIRCMRKLLGARRAAKSRWPGICDKFRGS
jgi:hypothetical protein